MHRVARGALLLAACSLLMGFPKVARVHGTVIAHTGILPNALLRRPKQLKVGDLPTPFRMVKVADGAFVTLREKDCELTFTESFPMPWKLTTCDRKDRDDNHQEQQEQQETGQDQESSPGQRGTSSQSQASTTTQSNGSSTTASSTAASSATGTAGGLTGLQATLATIAATLAGKEAYDAIKGNGEPLSH